MSSISHLASLYAGRYSVADFDREPRSLYLSMIHILSIPGKRIRPLLLLLSCDAFGGDVEQALPVSHAMELFHNFTLVHDDIMDDASLRRGIPAVHEQFGLNAGILAGDALLIYSYKHLCQIESTALKSALDIFNRTAIEIMEGQQMDIDFEKRLDVTLPEYMVMIGYKTSVLLACSLQIGAIIGSASAEDQKHIYDFGMKLGLSFQIKDDWLDTFGESTKVGKKPGGDILQNKKTYLLITLLADMNDTDRTSLISLMSGAAEDVKISRVKELYEKYHVSTKTLAKVEALYQESIDALKALSIPESDKANLYAMAEMIHRRDF